MDEAKDLRELLQRATQESGALIAQNTDLKSKLDRVSQVVKECRETCLNGDCMCTDLIAKVLCI